MKAKGMIKILQGSQYALVHETYSMKSTSYFKPFKNSAELEIMLSILVFFSKYISVLFFSLHYIMHLHLIDH